MIVSVSPDTAVVMLVPPAILNVSPVPSVAPVESSPTNCMLVSTFMPVKLDPSPANAVAVSVPFTCSVVEGSEVPIPTRLFVTSRYSRFVSNARSVPFLVKFDFSTDPVIRPMAIPGTPYNNVSAAYATHGLDIIADRQQYRYL